MEAKNIIAFDFEKEERIYRLQMPIGAPLAEAYEASVYFMEEMVRMINQHAKDSLPKDPHEEERKEEYIEPEVVVPLKEA